MNEYNKTETLIDREQTSGYLRGEDLGGGARQRKGVKRYKLLGIKY